jgi:hypothetical protein
VSPFEHLAPGALAISLALQGQLWYSQVAFVALVKPLDSIKGAASYKLAAFFALRLEAVARRK